MGRSDFSLTSFLKAASTHGMPTRFLAAVQSNYTLKFGEEDEDDFVRPATNRMFLKPSTVESAQGVSLDLPRGEALAVQTIYHEGTHAYLDLIKDQPAVAALIREGERHYRGAPLVDKSKGDDYVRLFQEAMGEYVGHRAAAFWSASEDLYLAEKAHAANKASGRRFWDNFRGIPRRYEQATGQRVFGYQNKGWPWSRSQVETTKAISGRMKDFADRAVLENAIPDQFARVKKFVTTYKTICKSVPGFHCEF